MLVTYLILFLRASSLFRPPLPAQNQLVKSALKEVTDDKRSGACFGISLDQVNLKETAHTFVSPKRIEYAINKWNYMAPGVGSIIELVQLNLDSWSGSEVAKLERLNQDAEILAALNVMFYSNHLLTDNTLSSILTFLPSG